MVDVALQELEAMKVIMEAVLGLPEDSRVRVIGWVAERAGLQMGKQIKVSGGFGQVRDSNGSDGSRQFEDLPALYEAASPRTETDKVLVASYFFQKIKGQASLESFALNKELKNLGHAISNITKAFTTLSAQKPQLAIQTHKSSSGKMGRKKYRLTLAGINAVERMLGQAPSTDATGDDEQVEEQG
jgi:hypothetical protein